MNKSKLKSFCCVCLIFLLSTFYLFSFNIFPKQICTICDEFFYFDIARSIHFGWGINVFSAPSNFKNVLYPLIISPIFGISNPQIRMYILSLANCFIIASSAIPLYLIAKRYLNFKNTLVILIINALSPCLFFSISFFAEILYYPLMLWAIFFYMKAWTNNKLCLYLISSLLFFLLFLCKESTLCIFLSTIFFEIFIFVKKYVKNRSKTILLNKIIEITSFFVLFVSLYFIYTKLIIKISESTYGANLFTQIGFIFNSFKNFTYSLYSTIYTLMAFMLSTLILPFICPLFCFKKMYPREKETFLFLIFAVIVFSITISVTVTLPEERYSINPRGMLRYFGSLPILFVLLFTRLTIETNTSRQLFEFSKRKLVAFAIVTASFIIIYKGCERGLNLDLFPIAWYSTFVMLLKNNTFGNTYLYILPFINSLICIVLYLFAYKHAKYGKYKYYFHICLLFSSVFSLYTPIYEAKSFYNVSNLVIDNVIEIDNYLDFHYKGNKVLCIFDNGLQSFDSYITKSDKYVFQIGEDLKSLLSTEKEEKIKVSNIEFVSPYLHDHYVRFDKIDYIVIKKSVNFKDIMIDDSKLSKITLTKECQWFLYANTNPLFINKIV